MGKKFKNPFRSTSNHKFYTPENQSQGIFDDFAERKVLATKEFAGNCVFVQGGMCFGGLSLYDNVTADTIASGSFVQLTRFDTNSPYNLTLPDHTNDHIEIIKAGVYKVMLSVSFSGTGSVTWAGGIFKNNGSTQLTNLQTARKLGATGDVGSASISGIAEFSVGDTVEVWFKHLEGVDKNITVKHCTLSVMQIGG